MRITSEGDASAIDLFAGAVLTLVAADQSSNSLTAESGGAYEDMGEPGIHVPEDAALIVLGEGSLSVTGGSSLTGAGGVGIGGKPGGLPLGIEEADLDACISIPRNKMLANILPSRSSRGRSG